MTGVELFMIDDRVTILSEKHSGKFGVVKKFHGNDYYVKLDGIAGAIWFHADELTLTA